MSVLAISLETANTFYSLGLKLTVWGAAVTFLGALLLAWGTRVRDAEQERLNQQQAWRSVSAEQQQTLIVALTGHPMKVWVNWVGNDPEATTYHDDINQALKAAGIETNSYSGYVRALGLTIKGMPGPEYDLLLAAFEKAGMRLSPEPYGPGERFPGQLQIVVGSKPPPSLPGMHE